jgi:hypothetical protein
MAQRLIPVAAERECIFPWCIEHIVFSAPIEYWQLPSTMENPNCQARQTIVTFPEES